MNDPNWPKFTAEVDTLRVKHKQCRRFRSIHPEGFKRCMAGLPPKPWLAVDIGVEGNFTKGPDIDFGRTTPGALGETYSTFDREEAQGAQFVEMRIPLPIPGPFFTTDVYRGPTLTVKATNTDSETNYSQDDVNKAGNLIAPNGLNNFPITNFRDIDIENSTRGNSVQGVMDFPVSDRLSVVAGVLFKAHKHETILDGQVSGNGVNFFPLFQEFSVWQTFIAPVIGIKGSAPINPRLTFTYGATISPGRSTMDWTVIQTGAAVGAGSATRGSRNTFAVEAEANMGLTYRLFKGVKFSGNVRVGGGNNMARFNEATTGGNAANFDNGGYFKVGAGVKVTINTDILSGGSENFLDSFESFRSLSP
ncbi:MAG: hypothetical protein CMM48_10285 [Rhodospirillaceae bacterium]|nr:hypothetical protein [Rhodospirillaceae bacterium]